MKSKNKDRSRSMHEVTTKYRVKQGFVSQPLIVRHEINNDAALRLLKLWREGDEQEQRETWDLLKHALDEDRLSGRKLFA
jgi:hypothetical protein